MDMIGHETIADNRRIPFIRVTLQEVKIHIAVFRAEENVCPIIASLDNVMRESWSDRPGYSWHKKVYIKKLFPSRIKGCVPIYEAVGIALLEYVKAVTMRNRKAPAADVLYGAEDAVF